MSVYKIETGEVGGFGNRIYKKGDTVEASNFPPGNAEKLEKMGILSKVLEPTAKEKAAEKKALKEAEELAKKEAKEAEEAQAIADKEKEDARIAKENVKSLSDNIE